MLQPGHRERHGMNFWHKTIRNHGLEHATISLLMQEFKLRGPMAGYSIPRGFFILGNATLDQIEKSTSLALTQFQEGEKGLAISPYCGTNILTSATLATIASLAGYKLSGGGLKGFNQAVSAVTFSLIASQPIGKILQKRFTTSSDMANLRLGTIKQYHFGPLKVHWVSTTIISDH